MTQPSAEQQRVLGSAGLIGLTAVGAALIGFCLQLIVAYYFGASSSTDAYFMASSSSELLSKLLLGGSITAVFLPMFVQRLTSGVKHEAWQLALNILHIFAAVFLVLLAGVAIFTRPFVAFIAPGFDADTQALTVSLIRVLIPSFFFLFLVDMGVAMLHALKQFAIPASLRLISPSISIIATLLLARSLGIYALAIGVVAGSLTQIIFVGRGLYHQGLRYHLVWHPFDAGIRRLLYLVYPFIFSALVTQSAGVIYRVLVSDLAVGSLSALKYAEKITQLVTIIFLNSVTTVIYPLLSEKASHRDIVGIKETLAAAIRLTTFLTIPITIGVVLLRAPLIDFIYRRGSFTVEDAHFTSVALLFLVIGFTTNALSSIFGHATLAMQQTRAAVAVTICSQAIAIMLFVVLVPRLELAGLALASSLVPISAALLYFLYLSRYIPRLVEVFWHPTFLKIAVLAVGLAAALSMSLTLVSHLGLPSGLYTIVALVVPTAVGSAVFFGGAYVWHIPEMMQVLHIAKRKVLER